ncbi:methyltransferase [Aestuariicella hydrocarbonica]|uniref:Ribosomal RNA large subunit methyltransferase G n=1 Tax=Pseudomaricurvus hydrocarbonicus TaxID=1470433 RepID=A0A9E5MGM6_9GAMM|nr:methyltransferase [Aestuariicella hydrocarbonica]NHO64881.1 methyltransferase [Aestuariicella hydrocarbonica]
MPSHTQLKTPFGSFRLERYPKPATPKGKQQPLRAWDAADEYLLQWLFDWQKERHQPPATLILNDSFGALSIALTPWPRWSQTDSYLAQQGCSQNRLHNDSAHLTHQLSPAEREQPPVDGHWQPLTSLQWPDRVMDLVVIKIPKTLALLEDQLYHLRQVIGPGTTIVGAAMTKNIHNSTLALFEKILGTTTTSLAQKKARLIFCQPQPQHWQGKSPYPSEFSTEEFPFAILNHANVFSRSSLDIGSRFFLQHLPAALAGNAVDIIDLGCGNGVLGITAKHVNAEANIDFVDESFMAIESARLNVAAAQACGYLPPQKTVLSTPECPLSTPECTATDQPTQPGSGDLQFTVGNSLHHRSDGSADLILNNPPFHQQSVVGDHIAWQMFNDARRVLRRGGEFWVIGNRHLDYHLKLKRLFGHCQTVASNRKFVVLRSVKR